MIENGSLHLFHGYGVELEYMIVERESLSVLPVADQVLMMQAGEQTGELTAGPLRWSNELALHVIELKTDGPAPALAGLAEQFQAGVADIQKHLATLGGRLMPTAMHPWMNPQRETRLWPWENSPIYRAYNRIFSCQGHGWSNLQSVHLNLPFQGDEEFGRLHAAIRLVLPLLPALAASSPVIEGALSGVHDTRLHVYRNNQRRVPEITGKIIPEAVFTRADYEREILQRTYRAIAPLDPEGVLQEEWLNSRGAIARFERNTIEIRLIDIQECPQADLAVLILAAEVIRALTLERWRDRTFQAGIKTDLLAGMLEASIREGENAVLRDAAYLSAFGCAKRKIRMGELWALLLEELLPEGAIAEECILPLRTILDQGSLASRITHALGQSFSRMTLEDAYRELCDCLEQGRMFRPYQVVI